MKEINHLMLEYEDIYQKNPGTFLERMSPHILAFDAQKLSLLMRFKTEPWMRNPGDTVHGGIISTMADITMCGLIRFMLHDMSLHPTIDLNVRFLRPVPVGKDVFVRAVCHKRGAKLSFLNCKAFHESTPSKLLFTAESTVFIL